MSVHTKITQAEVAQFLQQYSLGDFIGFTGIAEGITNTIYRLETSSGFYLLTLFETLAEHELPFFINFMQYLQTENYPLPAIIAMESGAVLGNVAGKPVMLTQFLSGHTLSNIAPLQAKSAGDVLGQLHILTTLCQHERENIYDLAWHKQLAKYITPYLTAQQQKLLLDELTWQEQQDYSELPTGLCHMDLFPDNVLFHGNTLMGVLDFYFACNNYYLLDLAVAMCAWSLTDTAVNISLGEELMKQYQTKRALTEDELSHLNNMQRYAALHFWLTRLRDKHLVVEQEGVLVKEPFQFETLLLELHLQT